MLKEAEIRHVIEIKSDYTKIESCPLSASSWQALLIKSDYTRIESAKLINSV